MRSTMKLQLLFLLLLGVAVSSTIADQRRLGGVAVSATVLDLGASCLSPSQYITYEDALAMLQIIRGKSGELRLSGWETGVVLAASGTAKLVINSLSAKPVRYSYDSLIGVAVRLVQSCLVDDNDQFWVQSGVQDYVVSNVVVGTVLLGLKR